jgi:CHAT domain-containing protein
VTRDALAGGPPPRLPFSRREARAALALVPASERREALDFEASRATVTGGILGQYRVVHFATHGYVNSQRPQLSGIVLSLVDPAGRPQDGFLTASDLYNLDLNAELLVLSGCETALGRELRGEGLVGLARAFMYAGAPRVVASTWKVDDAATAALMSAFYRGMFKEKLAPAAALRAAQLELQKGPRFRHPYYWAGFQLQGEWR